MQTICHGTLAFLVIGTVAAVAGFRLGVGWRPTRQRALRGTAPRLHVSMARLLIILAVYFLIDACYGRTRARRRARSAARR